MEPKIYGITWRLTEVEPFYDLFMGIKQECEAFFSNVEGTSRYNPPISIRFYEDGDINITDYRGHVCLCGSCPQPSNLEFKLHLDKFDPTKADEILEEFKIALDHFLPEKDKESYNKEHPMFNLDIWKDP
jgi:hypothetical protein